MTERRYLIVVPGNRHIFMEKDNAEAAFRLCVEEFLISGRPCKMYETNDAGIWKTIQACGSWEQLKELSC